MYAFGNLLEFFSRFLALEIVSRSSLHRKRAIIGRGVKCTATASCGFPTPRTAWNSPGEGVLPINGLYRGAPPERGTFFRLQVYKRVGISRAEVYERVGKSVI